MGGEYMHPDFSAHTRNQGSSYAQRSAEYRLHKEGTGPIGTCYREKRSIFIPDATCETVIFDSEAGCDITPLKRQALAKAFDIGSIAFIPFEMGVLEFGTCRVLSPNVWPRMPDVPTSKHT